MTENPRFDIISGKLGSKAWYGFLSINEISVSDPLSKCSNVRAT
jgi:hypothetical protein